VILWRLTLSKKLGQPNLGIMTTAIYKWVSFETFALEKKGRLTPEYNMT
jgi:hypothetical protein